MAGPREQVFLATPITAAGGRIIASPFQFWLTGEDHLRLACANSASGVVLQMRARFLNPDGTITAANWSHTPLSDRTVTHETFPLAAGALLNLIVIASSGTPSIGQTYVLVQLLRGLGTGAIALGTLVAGYVTSWQWQAWPGSPIITSTEGEPVVRAITGTAPANNADISESVPTGARWELCSLHCTAARPGGTGAARAAFAATIAGTTYMEIPTQQPYDDTGTFDVSWLAGFSTPATFATLNRVVSSIPNQLLLPAGSTLKVRNPGDTQFGAPHLIVREWLEVN